MIFGIFVLCHLKLCAHQKPLRNDAENHPKLIKKCIPRVQEAPNTSSKTTRNFRLNLDPTWDRNGGQNETKRASKNELEKATEKDPKKANLGPGGRVRPVPAPLHPP